jgi:hypothetical protein
MLNRCDQTKCAFHRKNNGENMCPVCDECGAKSNYVEDNCCVSCYNCIKDNGFIRRGDPDSIVATEEKEVFEDEQLNH